jgi:hypothetical protein
VKDMSVVLLWRGSVTSDGQRSEEDTEATSRSCSFVNASI